MNQPKFPEFWVEWKAPLDSGIHALNSGFQTIDCGLHVSWIRIPDTHRWRDSDFFELNFGFRSPWLQTPQDKLIIFDSGFHMQKFPGFLVILHLAIIFVLVPAVNNWSSVLPLIYCTYVIRYELACSLLLLINGDIFSYFSVLTLSIGIPMPTNRRRKLWFRRPEKCWKVCDSDEQFNGFLERHSQLACLVPESNEKVI